MSERATYVADLEGFINDLEMASSRMTRDVTDKVLMMIGESVAERARDYAPRDTGELQNSFEVVMSEQGVHIRSTAPYAAYVEFGTWSHNVINPRQGTYTIRPTRPGGVLRFTGSQGKPVFAKKVEHPGVRPQPFMGPASVDALEEMSEKIGNVGVKLVLG